MIATDKRKAIFLLHQEGMPLLELARIKAFLGTSDNAVKTQLWIAVCVYVLVAIIKKELKLEPSLNTILQVLSVNVFQQEPLPQLFTQYGGVFSNVDSPKQLILSGLWPDSNVDRCNPPAAAARSELSTYHCRPRALAQPTHDHQCGRRHPPGLPKMDCHILCWK